MNVKIILGDCLQKLSELSNESIDLVLTDPPYGTTACSWDSIIPFEPMWNQLNRITKNNSPILLFGSEPFSSYLRMSNIKNFKYDWIWHKNTPTGFALAKFRPMKYHEIISVFYQKQPIYNPIKQERFSEKSKKVCKNEVSGYYKNKHNINMNKIKVQYDSEYKNPESVICIKSEPNSKGKLHPTQKPVELLEYLIKTYTNENDTVLDFTAGSFSTAIAAINTNRNFIGIENDSNYFNIAIDRINNHVKLLQFIHNINVEIIQ